MKLQTVFALTALLILNSPSSAEEFYLSCNSDLSGRVTSAHACEEVLHWVYQSCPDFEVQCDVPDAPVELSQQQAIHCRAQSNTCLPPEEDSGGCKEGYTFDRSVNWRMWRETLSRHNGDATAERWEAKKTQVCKARPAQGQTDHMANATGNITAEKLVDSPTITGLGTLHFY